MTLPEPDTATAPVAAATAPPTDVDVAPIIPAPLEALEPIYRRPVFLIGAPRSGTTWLQRMLLTHPDIAGGEESHFFAAFAPAMEKFKRGCTHPRQVGMPFYWSPAAFHDMLRALWRRTMQSAVSARPEARILLEKSPQHTRHMRWIVELLPEARFIHLIRDSRGVAASLLAISSEVWAQPWAPRTARGAAKLWSHHVHSARAAQRHLPLAGYIEVHYEDLLARPEPELARLCAFMELDAAPVSQMAEAHTFERLVKAGGTSMFPRHGQPHREPPKFLRRGKADGWRQDLSLIQQLIIWRHTRRPMRAMGYTFRGGRGDQGGDERAPDV